MWLRQISNNAANREHEESVMYSVLQASNFSQVLHSIIIICPPSSQHLHVEKAAPHVAAGVHLRAAINLHATSTAEGE